MIDLHDHATRAASVGQENASRNQESSRFDLGSILSPRLERPRAWA